MRMRGERRRHRPFGRGPSTIRSLRAGRMDLLALTLVASIGVLIGAVGIGGFLVVPVLVFVQGRPLREAVVAATVSFVGAGLVSLALVARERVVRGRDVTLFVAMCAPGALAGAWLLRVLDARIVA